MIGVLVATAPYRWALAELPLSTRLTDRPGGAIVVVSGGDGWVDVAQAAAEAGAAGLVVADPTFAPASAVRRLARGLAIPVIVERPLLRRDVAEDVRRAGAGSAPRALVVDGAAGESHVRTVARDAAGWLRVMAGGALSVVRADGAFALLETDAGVAATLTVVATVRPGSGAIRAQALGEVTTEVEVEGRSARVIAASVAGRLTAPSRFESSERLSLRRALDALTARIPPSDLDELAADTEIVERMPTASA